MRFVALDVETANPNMSSICQIGIVLFDEGAEVRAEKKLVNPKTWFDPLNTEIHGLDERAVSSAPTFVDLHDWLCSWTNGETVVCHTHFDRVSLAQACARSRIANLACTWLDSARVAKRAWPQFAQRGWGLANLADYLGIELEHHDALQDARTAGAILLRAMQESGLGLTEWIKRATQPVTGNKDIQRVGDGDGGLLGEVIVFTGALQIPRREAADRAAEAGGDVHPGVTKKTTMLVVGDQDIAKLNGHQKSSKHLKAEALIAGGQMIRIVGESDFMVISSIVD